METKTHPENLTSSRETGISRRSLITGIGAAAVGACCLAPERAAADMQVRPGTVRDHLWLFAVPANTDFGSVQRRSLMTPAEAAYYLGIPNIIIVQASSGESKYGRFEPPFEQYTVALRPFRRIVWSVTGSGGFHADNETREVLDLVKRIPNFTGIMLDDFFSDKKDGRRAVLTVEELSKIRQELKSSGKKLDIFATYYTQLLKIPLDDYLKLIDVLTLWTWKSAEIPDIPRNIAALDKVAPRARKMLGCYLYDFSLKQPVPVPAMEQQCNIGLDLLKKKRIDGIIFLANTVADLGFDSVEWTRNWIQKVGDSRI